MQCNLLHGDGVGDDDALCVRVCVRVQVCVRERKHKEKKSKSDAKIYLQLVKANKNNKAANDEQIKRKGMHNKDREKTLNY